MCGVVSFLPADSFFKIVPQPIHMRLAHAPRHLLELARQLRLLNMEQGSLINRFATTGLDQVTTFFWSDQLNCLTAIRTLHAWVKTRIVSICFFECRMRQNLFW